MTADNFVNISDGNVQGFIQANNGTITQNFITQVSEFYSGQAPGAEKLTPNECRQRKVLLSKVKEYWIEGVLEKSLQTKAMIELGLEKRSDAVERPFSGFEELPEESRQILPTGTDATKVFNQIGEGRTLLILGEPGAGKTITLLKLAENLITRAEEDPSRLIPVVFNLSSWRSKRQTIADWLVQELWSKYQVPKEVGKDWVKNQQLLLLLDGLDEVKDDRREACVEAINQFMQEHGQTEMVVCSRIADYEVLSNRLQLRGAVYIRSLTTAQVNQYLDTAGEQLQAVKSLLTEDTALQELAKSPLTLSIMTLAYQGKKVEELPQTGSVEARREHLFNSYIERMLQRKGINQQYPKERTIHWLTWLAQRMSQESQSIFLIEQMQPSWLQNQNQKIAYRIRTFMFSGLPSGLIGGLISWVIFNHISGANIAFYYFLYYLLVIGLISGLITSLPKRILPLEQLSWSLKRAKSRFVREACIGIGFGLVLGLFVGLPDYRTLDWRFGLTGGLLFCLLFALGSGLGSSETFQRKDPNLQRKDPNQGIRTSLINCLLMGLIVGPIGGWILGIFFESVLNLSSAASLGSFFGLIGVLFLGLKYGGSAVIQHFTLRQMLHEKGSIPWNYALFLDYATDRIFLQKVGGGYIFVHRMLLEHFALMKWIGVIVLLLVQS
jgi:energy-coupling factor transporter ATP-binding protein EcfA2